MKTKINTIHNLLINKNKTISLAESCTGGMLATIMTSLSGSSHYFILGLVTYSNNSKTKLLKINKSTIEKYGAVSKQTALLMAKNIRKIAKTDISLSITGIAGPTGATKNKKLGTVYIALANNYKLQCNKFSFNGARESIRKQSCLKALELLYEDLKK